MNILISYDWLKEYLSTKKSADDFAARVSLSGPGVEHLYPQANRFQHMVVGKVVAIDPHPKADKLLLAKTDIGDKKATIVCGGSNLVEGQWVAVANVGAKVLWHGEGDLVELKPVEIRGVKSEGMICAANEIGLFDAFPHAEREILDLGNALADKKLAPGMPLAKAFDLEKDIVMDIEVTSNRPDVFSLVGMARECAAILKEDFTWKPAKLPKTSKKALDVKVSEPELCPRYMGVRIDGVKNGHSPWWMKQRLMSAGLRPINTLVDITNYVMLELGQPMHAFDAAQLAGGKIQVRKAKKGEELACLDGEIYELADTHLVIADNEKPVAIAGVMGGEETAVTPDTISVVFEAATFDPVAVRKTARDLSLYSDSQLRFEKGLSTEATEDALARAIELCLELCGGTLATGVADVRKAKYKPQSYEVSFEEINRLVGIEIPSKQAADILKRLGFALATTTKKLKATVPWWRDHDIEAGRDLIEEIARMEGYANLPAAFPSGASFAPTDPSLALEKELRHALAGAGLHEIFTYSFVSREVLELAKFDPSGMLRVQNPLSADYEFMRTSLSPSMLQVMAQNQDRFSEQSLFEIAHVYFSKDGAWKNLPEETPMLSMGILDDDAWKKIKGYCEHVFDLLHIDVEWRPLEEEGSLWHPGRSAQAFSGDTLVATCGELHPERLNAYGFESRVGLADLPIHELLDTRQTAIYTPLPQFPEAKRDLAIMVSRDVSVADIQQLAEKTSDILTSIEWFDTYEGKGLPEGKKSLAFHLSFSKEDRTLETEEVEAAMKEIIEGLEKEFEAELRG